MSRSTTTTEEFDSEGNLLKRTVEVWEDEPTIELDVAEEPENDKVPNTHAVRMAGIVDTTGWGPHEWYLYGLGQENTYR